MEIRKQKALFVHSHVFLYDKDDIAYTEGNLPYEVWKRYLVHFDELYIAGRNKSVNRADKYAVSSGSKVKHIKLPNINSTHSRIKNKKEVYEKLSQLIEEVDVVIARLPNIYSEIAIKLARKQKKTYVVEVVGDVYEAYKFHGSLIGKIIAPFAYRKTKKYIKKSPYVLYVTEKYLQEKYPSENLVVTTSCSNVEINDNAILKQEAKSPKKPFEVGLIGSYASKYKGIENAIRAIKKISDDGYDIKLKILGTGKKEYLEEIIEEYSLNEKVILEGALPAGQPVLDWLVGLDIYIQPSLTEGLPRSLIEAMYCGLPCIGSSVGGIPELLEPEFIHEPKDEEALIQKIINLYEDKDLRDEQSKINKMKSLEYTKEKLDSKRRKFWQEVLNDANAKE